MRTILVNVSIQFKLVKLKLKQKIVVLRLDGAYHDNWPTFEKPFWFTLGKYYLD